MTELFLPSQGTGIHLPIRRYHSVGINTPEVDKNNLALVYSTSLPAVETSLISSAISVGISPVIAALDPIPIQ